MANKNFLAASVLLAAALIGFSLGRITAPGTQGQGSSPVETSESIEGLTAEESDIVDGFRLLSQTSNKSRQQFEAQRAALAEYQERCMFAGAFNKHSFPFCDAFSKALDESLAARREEDRLENLQTIRQAVSSID